MSVGRSLLEAVIMKRMLFLLLVTAGLCVALGMSPGDLSKVESQDDPRDRQWSLNINPHEVIGYENCEKCHAPEVSVWKQTPHYRTFVTLHRNPDAQQIADKLGITSFKNDSNCTQCHYTMQQGHDGMEAISGISCESCHGAAKNWVSVHNDYGGEGVTREAESPQHRLQRLTSSIQAGMRNPLNVYMVAQSCYRCHTVPDEQLVNVGGHKAGSMDFEFVAWSQGSVDTTSCARRANPMTLPVRIDCG
jgi:hypothetical protein